MISIESLFTEVSHTSGASATKQKRHKNAVSAKASHIKTAMSDNKPTKPLPTFLGVALPHTITVHNDEDLTPSRRVAGGVAFDEPLLQSSPVKSTAVDTDMLPSMTPTVKSTMISKVTPTEIPSTPSGWNEKLLQDIPGLPAFSPVEPTAVFVPNASVARVADRITSILRERSIEARLGYAEAACTTLEGVEFGIRLYRGPGPSFDHGIIVEVQRHNGTSLRFYEDILAILYAARNKPRSSSSGNYLPPVGVDSDAEDDDDDRQISSGALDLVFKMFSHPGTHQLALETLITFTDPAKMGTKTARTVSRHLLEPGNNVRAKIMSLVIVDNNKNGLRVMAMEALANALQVRKISCVDVDELQSVLVQDLWRCDTNPRVAYMAARCIEPLVDGHDEQLYEALQHSIAVGNAKYAVLAQQATKCTDRF